MTDPTDLADIAPKAAITAYSAGHVLAGLPVPKTRRLELFSPGDWEEFVEEWASSLKTKYVRVQRFSGAGDKGVDVAGFLSNSWFAGGWENYQCKHYDHAMYPSDAWLELGKLIYFTWKGEFPAPQRYFFVAPHGVGTSLAKLLASPDELHDEFIANWDKYCKSKITDTGTIDLQGDLLSHANSFNYGIFDATSSVQLIEQHATTPFHTVRFGGGLPPRALTAPPPDALHPDESRYIEQLYAAYSDHMGETISAPADLSKHPSLARDFLRQRERFYSAESLANFARDNVPPGTFEALQKEALHGVIDVCEASHACGLTRMRETLNQSLKLPFSSNPLVSAMQSLDKQGLCHQLANKDELIWVPSK